MLHLIRLFNFCLNFVNTYLKSTFSNFSGVWSKEIPIKMLIKLGFCVVVNWTLHLSFADNHGKSFADKSSGMINVRTVWHSDGILKEFFFKKLIWKTSADVKKAWRITQYAMSKPCFVDPEDKGGLPSYEEGLQNLQKYQGILVLWSSKHCHWLWASRTVCM